MKNIKLIFLVTYILFYSYKAIAGEFVTVYLNMPQSARAGSEFIVEITINKGDITGFAKYQNILPEGFYAEPLETKNATFIFKDNIVKFLWLALPADTQLTISYNVRVDNYIASATYDISGIFSYILTLPCGKKEPKQAFAVPQSIEIISDILVADLDKTMTDSNKASLSSVDITYPPPVDDYNITSYTIDDNFIDQKNIDDLNINIESANYSSDKSENISEIVDWIDKTKDESLEKSDITSTLDKADVIPDIKTSGIRSGFENITYKVQIAASRFPLSENRLRNIYNKNESINNEIHNNEWYKYTIGNFNSYNDAKKVKAQCGVNDAFIIAYSEGKQVNIAKVINSSPAAQAKEIIFRVQIAAFQKLLSNEYLKEIYSSDRIINVEKHEGLNKYSVGDFYTYQDAKNFKQHTGVHDAFVIAYRNGKRISVREAILQTTNK